MGGSTVMPKKTMIDEIISTVLGFLSIFDLPTPIILSNELSLLLAGLLAFFVTFVGYLTIGRYLMISCPMIPVQIILIFAVVFGLSAVVFGAKYWVDILGIYGQASRLIDGVFVGYSLGAMGRSFRKRTHIFAIPIITQWTLTIASIVLIMLSIIRIIRFSSFLQKNPLITIALLLTCLFGIIGIPEIFLDQPAIMLGYKVAFPLGMIFGFPIGYFVDPKELADAFKI